jgi:thioredoxin-related protein
MIQNVILTVLLTVFGTNCCCYVSIMSGNVDVCADEEPKDEQKRKVVCLFGKGRCWVCWTEE